MLKTKIVLPDGTALSSGTDAQNVIVQCRLTQCVNDAQELTLGAVCASMLEVTLLTPGGGLVLHAGEEIQAYKEDEKGKLYPMGVFIAEKPMRPSANCMKITAYDRVVKLDKDLSAWLAGLDGWPYMLLDFANMVCQMCGVTLINTQIPNGTYPVRKFSAAGITGRQLMQWIGQAAGRFCRATPEGMLEFAWYTPGSIAIGPTKGENISPFFMNKLTYEDYTTAPVEKVQIRMTEQDVGAIYPDGDGERNTYIVSGNYLLTSEDAQELTMAAQVLYEILSPVAYTPCKVVIPANPDIRAGDIVQITDKNGAELTCYIMNRVQSGQTDTLECTGSSRRDTTTVINNSKYEALSGKVLELRKSVEGLSLENRNAAGQMAALTLTVESVCAEVSRHAQDSQGIKSQMTSLRQAADLVAIDVESIRGNGVDKVTTATGYTFAEDGLRIQKSGEEMENRLDHTGMYVERDGETILRANNQGVAATDVTVHNYLIIGTHARLEDYSSGRTACFYL